MICGVMRKRRKKGKTTAEVSATRGRKPGWQTCEIGASHLDGKNQESQMTMSSIHLQEFSRSFTESMKGICRNKYMIFKIQFMNGK